MCADIIAIIIVCAGVMPGSQHIHQLVTLSLLRVIHLSTSLYNISELVAHLHRRCLHMTALRRHKGDSVDQHMHMTTQGKGKLTQSVFSGNLNMQAG